MQPPRDPPAAVDALVAGSGRCAIRRQCPSSRAPLAAPIVSCSAGSIFASLWHARDTVPASPKHEPDERTLCGRLLGASCIVGRDPGAQEKSRARFVRAANCRARSGHRERFRAGIGRSGASECPNVARQQVYCPNLARKRSGIRKSPDNTTMFRSRPKTLRRARGRHAADERPVRSHGGLYATRTPFHASHSAQNAPVNPLNLPSTEARGKFLASRCRRQLPGSDSVQIHVRYLSDTSAFSLLAYLATNET